MASYFFDEYRSRSLDRGEASPSVPVPAMRKKASPSNFSKTKTTCWSEPMALWFTVSA